MPDSKMNDPNRVKWIEEERQVKPVILKPPELNNQELKGALKKEFNSGLEPYSGTWAKRQARHLLSRTLFGVKKADLDFFSAKTMDEAVEQIVSESPLPAPPVNDYEGINENKPDPHVGLGETWVEAPHGGGVESLRIVSLKCWQIKNIINQQPTIHEKLVLFWSNLLVTKVWDVFTAKASYKYFNMLYSGALGNYRKLIKDLTLDPSMLMFLNGASNTKNEPDENYGRELQELFCVGKGPGSNYTETDVQAAARVLTGWTIDWDTRKEEGPVKSTFNHFNHDKSDKKFSAFYGNKIIKGQLGGWGRDELDEMLDMIFNNQETAKYICRRIYSFFVSNVITATVEENIISPLAEIFRNNNYEIKPVLLKLFKSEHFYDELNRGALIKSPADYLLGLMRVMDIQPPDENDLVLNYTIYRALLWNMSNQGMEIGDPPSVAGWAPYYQAPQYDKAWITTDTITKRAKTTDSFLYWGFWVSRTLRLNADLPALVANFENPSDPNEMLKEAVLIFLGIEISENRLNELKSTLLSGQENDYYWTWAWNDYVEDPGHSTNKQTVENRLKPAFKQLLQMGEFYLM